MATVNRRMVDYGTSGNQVHLGIIPDSGSIKALTDEKQYLIGLKTFHEHAFSPNSSTNMDEVTNMELLTHAQLDVLVESKMAQIPKLYYTVTETTIEELLGRPLREDEILILFDPETGQDQGYVKPDGTYVPPKKNPPPPDPPYTLPDGTRVIPGYKVVSPIYKYPY
jgi:hypothetical protein